MLIRVTGKLIRSVTCSNVIDSKLDHYCDLVKRRTRNFKKLEVRPAEERPSNAKH